MSHQELPPASTWYGDMMHDDAALGSAAAERKWFPHEVHRSLESPRGERVRSGWTGAFIEAVVDRREYMLLPATPAPKSLAQLWREAVATVEKEQA